MKRALLVVALLGAGCLSGQLTRKSDVRAQDPCDTSAWKRSPYFEDLRVTRTVDHHEFTVTELMEMIDKQPNVRVVSLAVDPPRRFSVTTLAYPQYADRYMLTQAEWGALQAYARRQLAKGLAVDEVKEHWRSIANGTPPFGLRVQSR